MRPDMRNLLPLAILGAASLAYTSDAAACGCFTPPDPSVPIVQAGERIAFAMSNGTVTAHIQIQYQGTASDFGWLLPLPSVPTLELGTDELFTQLIGTTQPMRMSEHSSVDRNADQQAQDAGVGTYGRSRPSGRCMEIKAES